MRFFIITFLLLILSSISGHSATFNSGCGTIVWDGEEADLIELSDAVGKGVSADVSLNEVLGALCSRSTLVAKEMDSDQVDFKLILYADYFALRSRLKPSKSTLAHESAQAFYARGRNEIHLVLYESNPMILVHELAHHYQEQRSPSTDKLRHEAVAKKLEETLFVKLLRAQIPKFSIFRR